MIYWGDKSYLSQDGGVVSPLSPLGCLPMVWGHVPPEDIFSNNLLNSVL